MEALTGRKLFATLIVALVVLSWLALWVWGQSPYSRFLGHAQGGEFTIGHADPKFTLVFVGGWILMTVAMMLPTTLPLVGLFDNLVSGRPTRKRLVLLLITGYLSIWTLFGVVAHIGVWGLHRALELGGWLDTNARIFSTTLLLVAGIYQFTPLKYYCLEKCRSPLTFIMEHWRGGREAIEAFRLGWDHGIFCIGCCWSLMLLMFLVGAADIGWMLALGTLMAVEKNMPWGRRLSAPLGVFLVAAGLALILATPPTAHH